MQKSRVGFIWIYVLIVLFATGVIELVVMPAVQHKLVPELKNSANQTLSETNAAAYNVQVDTTIGYMHLGIYSLMLVVIIYGIVSVFQREETEYYGP